ncbi:MAG TPA: N-acetylmuramoyl-L-alanine amidase [Bacteroidota bacterium]
MNPCLRVRFCSTLLLALSIFVSRTLADQKKITLQIEQQPLRTLRGFDSVGVTYLAFDEFVSALSLPSTRNDTARKFEVRLSDHRIKVTANSSFVVITELATNTASISQLPHKVLQSDSTYFVPLPSFIQLFARLSPVKISYDHETAFLFVGTRPPRTQFDITGIELEPRLNGYLLTIHASRKLNDVEAWLKKDDGWLFVTIPDATADTVALKQTKTFGAIREILVFPSPTSVQLTFRVAPDVVPPPEIIGDPSSNNILISLRTSSELEKAELERRRQEVIRQKVDSVRARWKMDVIVIDAGHGGKDPGTIGVTGTREKDVALAIALKLGKLLEQNLPDVKIVYTRKTDKFIELYRRTQIANEASGKLFISIHCNATERKPSNARGFEIYLLRPGKEESAIQIAERENSVVSLEEDYQQRYKKLTEEDFIILTMAQSAFVKHSESFAEITASTMAKHMNVRYTGVKQVKQAGFYVLVGASMPNVLVETGYLSNRTEEKTLKSPQGQTKIAEALLKGIQEYRRVYEKALQEGDIGSN